ncbi:MAG: hypothetical protein GY940_29945 [bacterium]|nr:hypothetical protein [bacterium]
MSEHRITARAPGKLILLGEYAVLEGAPALVAAVDRYARVEIQCEGPGNGSFILETPGMNIPPLTCRVDEEGNVFFVDAPAAITRKMNFFTAAFSQGWRTFVKKGTPPFPSRILLDTSDFFHPPSQSKLGFGSSAALTIALLGALNGASGELQLSGENHYHLYHTGMESHYRAQGNNGSGVDIAAAVWGGVLRYRISPNPKTPDTAAEIEPVIMTPDLHFLPFWTGNSSSTHQLIQKVRLFKTREPSHYSLLIEKMTHLSVTGLQAFSDNHIPTFLHVAGQYAEAMRKLGELSGTPIMSSQHLELSRIAAENGAVYKPSGAGGGDMGIVFADSGEIIEKTEIAARQSGFQPVPTGIAPRGIHIQKESK